MLIWQTGFSVYIKLTIFWTLPTPSFPPCWHSYWWRQLSSPSRSGTTLSTTSTRSTWMRSSTRPWRTWTWWTSGTVSRKGQDQTLEFKLYLNMYITCTRVFMQGFTLKINMMMHPFSLSRPFNVFLEKNYIVQNVQNLWNAALFSFF